MASHVPVNTPVSFELAALNVLMETVVSLHDPRIWLQFYTQDGSFAYSRHPSVNGREALDEFLKEHVMHLPVFEKLAIRNHRVDNFDDFVVEYASHIAVIRHGDFSGVFTGKDLRIWRREGCSLKIFRHIAMYD